MADKIDLTLPEVVWLSGGDHEPGGDPLISRNVLLHTPTAGIVEILLGYKYEHSDKLVVFKFGNNLSSGAHQDYTAVLLNYAADKPEDYALLQEQILMPVSRWFCSYMEWISKASSLPLTSENGNNTTILQ